MKSLEEFVKERNPNLIEEIWAELKSFRFIEEEIDEEFF